MDAASTADDSTRAVVHFDHWDPTSTLLTARSQYRTLLAGPPVTWSDEFGGFWVLTRYEDVKSALSDDTRFSSGTDGVQHPPRQGIRAPALEQDRPEHTAMRRLYAEWLNPRLLREFHPLIEELTEHYVGAFARSGGGDFVSEVSAKLPVQVIARTLGIDAADAIRLHESSEVTTTATDPARIGSAFDEIMGMCREQITRRHARPRPDFLSEALDWQIDGRAISDEELTLWLVGAIIAGHETTLLAGAGLISDLARDASLQQRLRQDPSLAPRAVEESLRLNSPVQRFFRTVTQDVTLHGVTMRTGERVMLVFAAANIDPAVFSRPLEIDIDRDFSRHLGFGWGIHRCVGAPLALHELRVMAETMLRTGVWTPADESPRYAAPSAFGSFLGLTSLPLVMTAF